ncbi:WASH complex subunit 3 [Hondaea fermentalgiana]|uniref:WASH complex subunit 3 n=1 Tax=Hondaea fermentalgiana TaxID=2315210 RepID=A0A2R5G648_9STRA|nr:WASH complex subunit 3 [Hondaea fermentalgiana]|eukprot:GBG26532.1 WASH complex subunit 3 [Hondaea fermentalgiana]
MAGSGDVEVVACVNAFLADTTSFLNRFAADCEARLVDVSLRMSRTESLLAVLEAKLHSVPGLTEPLVAAQELSPATTTGAAKSTTISGTDRCNPVTPSTGTSNASADELGLVLPAKYATLLRMGMPKEHLRLKMLGDGVEQAEVQRLLGDVSKSSENSNV